MKKNEFTKLIRETVSKEIRRSLKTELKNILSPPDNNVNTFNENIQHGVQMQQTAQRAPDDQQRYSNNEMINGILNETANNMKAYPTAGRPLSSQDAIGGRASLSSAMGLNPMPPKGQMSIQEMMPTNRQGVQIPEAVANNLTKDYSSLMKAINMKKNR